MLRVVEDVGGGLINRRDARARGGVGLGAAWIASVAKPGVFSVIGDLPEGSRQGKAISAGKSTAPCAKISEITRGISAKRLLIPASSARRPRIASAAAEDFAAISLRLRCPLRNLGHGFR